MAVVTVFTPTYNRAHTLQRVYDSLAAQTYRDFEWLVVDDGSTDDTKALIETFARKADFPIRYQYQENSGKHVAVNRAVEAARGELFVIADSDDSFLPQSLQILVGAWEDIPAQQRDGFKGVACRCYDPQTNQPINPEFSPCPLDSNDIEITFVHKCKGDLWGIMSTQVMQQYPFPEEKGLRFYPEGLLYGKIALSYHTRYINDALLAYYRNDGGSLTSKGGSRSQENMLLWQYYLNDLLGYFWKSIPLFCKAAVGVSMDGLQLGLSYKEIMARLTRPGGRFLCAVFWPAGAFLAWRRSR